MFVSMYDHNIFIVESELSLIIAKSRYTMLYAASIIIA